MYCNEEDLLKKKMVGVIFWLATIKQGKGLGAGRGKKTERMSTGVGAKVKQKKIPADRSALI